MNKCVMLAEKKKTIKSKPTENFRTENWKSHWLDKNILEIAGKKSQ